MLLVVRVRVRVRVRVHVRVRVRVRRVTRACVTQDLVLTTCERLWV